MVEKNRPEELITAKEAVSICRRAGTVDSLRRARAIYDAYMQEATKDGNSEHFYRSCALAAIYDAGRMQGIREERKARIAKK